MHQKVGVHQEKQHWGVGEDERESLLAFELPFLCLTGRSLGLLPDKRNLVYLDVRGAAEQ